MLKSLPLAARDGIGGVALLVVALIPLGVPGVDMGELHRTYPVWLTTLLAAGQALPLVLRRIRPALALLLVGGSFAACQILGANSGVAGLAVFVAIYSFAAYQSARRLGYEIACLVVYAGLATILSLEGSPERAFDWLTFLCVLTIPWFIGRLVRRRVAEQSMREARTAELAVQDARDELARDLHDIVTHHVTAMVVQADSASYLDAADVEERAHTLATIAATGRSALRELRSLLGALEHSRPQGTPNAQLEPANASVRSIVEEMRGRGYPVTMTEQDGAPELSDAVAVTVYRVAQEALTNAMKHAPGREVEVALTHPVDRVELSVSNALASGDGGIPGRGRRGMSERVALLGGVIETGARDGLFRVWASLPREDVDASQQGAEK